MSDVTLEKVLELAKQLSVEEQAALIEQLKPSDSLRNKYAEPRVDDLSDEELRASIRESAKEWEEELDEFVDTD